jgi:hypothetical protein
VGWSAVVLPWALARPADSLIHPRLQYYSTVTSADETLLTSSGGSVYDLQAPTNTVYAEFQAGDFAGLVEGHGGELEARIQQVSFGYELCQYRTGS